MKSKITKTLSLLMTIIIVVTMIPLSVISGHAITFEQLNSSSVFLKQAGSTTCTLCATTMMMRRYSMLRGDSGWASITESAVKPTAWINGTGLRWSFSYSNSSVSSISVGHYTLPGGSGNEAKIQAELKNCPEGIVIYNESVPHAVLLTDYTNGVYYCADPLGSYPSGRIPLTSSYKVRIDNVTAYWKVTSPIVDGPSTHTHNYSGARVYEVEHPHSITQRCVDYATCGGYKVTGEYAQVKTCKQCWYTSFDLSASSVSLKVGESKTISATINGFWPDTMVGVFDYDTSGIEVTTSQNAITFKGLKVGSYTLKLIIYSDSTKSYVIGSKSIPVTVSTHTHSYTGTHWEKAHPHRVYQKCSCGATQYVEGKYYTYTDGSCLTCVKPEKSTLLNMKSTYTDNESIKFEWTETENTTQYNIWIEYKNEQGDWKRYDQIANVSSGETRKLPVGEYRCCIQSYNSKYWLEDGSDWLYTESDYCYFSVVDPTPGKSTILNMKSTYTDNESIKFEWTETENTTQYNIWIEYKNEQGDWKRYDQIANVSSGETRKLPVGKYRCCIQSYNSKYWLEDGSDWLYKESDYFEFEVVSSNYTIKYDANGGEGSMAPTIHTYDVEKALAKNSFVREGYVFLGWSKDKNATVASYKDGATVSNLSAVGDGLVNLYAVWKEGFYGDVNEDGLINDIDVLMLSRGINGYEEFSLWSRIVGDLNGDGNLNEADVNLLSEFIVGLLHEFPVEKQEIILTVDALTFKSQYYVGEKFNSDNLSIWLYYSDTDYSYNVTEFCEVQIPDTSTIGQKELVVSLGGYTASYRINIVNKPTTETTTIPTITEESTAYTDASTHAGVVTDPTEITSSVAGSDMVDPTETYSYVSTEIVTDPRESTASTSQLVTDPAESTSTTHVETTADNTIPSSYNEVTTAPTTTDTEALVVRYLLGDANSDNKVSIQDATAIQKFIAKIFDFDDKQILASDADQNGKVNIKDVTVIQRYLAGYDVETPVNTTICLSSGDEEPTNPTDSDVVSSGDEESTTPTDSNVESSDDGEATVPTNSDEISSSDEESTIPKRLVENGEYINVKNMHGEITEGYIPKIMIDNPKIDVINKEIVDIIYSRLLWFDEETDLSEITYEWGVLNNILSITIFCQSSWTESASSRYVYNISLVDYEYADNEEVLKAASVDEETYNQRQKEAMGSMIWDGWGLVIEEHISKGEYNVVAGYANALEETLAQKNLDASTPYFNEKGELCVMGKINNNVGSRWHTRFINITDYVLSPYYKESIVIPES